MLEFFSEKIKFITKQFLNFVPTSDGVLSTLKNAPHWNFLRHRCLKCAHMSTIALTIIHTAEDEGSSFLLSTNNIIPPPLCVL